MGRWHFTRDGNGGWFKKWEDDSNVGSNVDEEFWIADDIGHIIFRTIVMTIGWLVFSFIVTDDVVNKGNVIVQYFMLIFKPSCSLFGYGYLGYLVPLIIISIVQNIIMLGKGVVFRYVILFGIPAIILVLTFACGLLF